MVITLNSDVYPIETILQTCYQFIEQAYFHIDPDDSGKKILVKITFKKDASKKDAAKEFRGKFLEELLHSSLRYSINQRNQKLREYIVGSALFSHDPTQAGIVPPQDVPLENDKKMPQGPLNDPLGIAVPWEKQNGKH
jgi:His-Xaa-Ser system protein HxsD